MQTGPVYIVDDDSDDQEMVTEIFRELNIPNSLVFFSKAQALLEHMARAEHAPFIILSDVNLPGMDGFQLRQKILDSNSPKFKSVPFIFWSTVASEIQIKQAYDLSVHGFFIKETSYDGTKRIFSHIFSYWNSSKMPDKNNF